MRSASRFFLIAILCLMPTVFGAQQLNDAVSGGDMRIPKGARLFISPVEGGYDIYLAAAIVEKKVPVILVTDKAKADFELASVTESEKANWAKMLFLSSSNSAEQASIKIVRLSSGNIVYGYNVHKSNSVRGKQSSAEACAKHLKDKIEHDDR